MEDQEECQHVSNVTLAQFKTAVLSRGFDDVIGYDQHKLTLRTLLVISYSHPQLFLNLEKVRSILLYGPRATGKTLFVHAAAAQTKADLYVINVENIIAFKGQTERKLGRIFNELKRLERPTILCIEHIELLYQADDVNDVRRRFKFELQFQLSELSSFKNRVSVLCTTRSPWAIDSPMLTRFQSTMYINLPDDKDRRSMLIALSRKRSCPLGNFLVELVNRTHGLTFPDIDASVYKAVLQPVMELGKTRMWVNVNGKIRPWNGDLDAKANHLHFCTFEQLPEHQVVARPVQLSDFELHPSDLIFVLTNEEKKKFTKFIASRV